MTTEELEGHAADNGWDIVVGGHTDPVILIESDDYVGLVSNNSRGQESSFVQEYNRLFVRAMTAGVSDKIYRAICYIRENMVGEVGSLSVDVLQAIAEKAAKDMKSGRTVALSGAHLAEATGRSPSKSFKSNLSISNKELSDKGILNHTVKKGRSSWHVYEILDEELFNILAS
jgi:hypothetical protein